MATLRVALNTDDLPSTLSFKQQPPPAPGGGGSPRPGAAGAELEAQDYIMQARTALDCGAAGEPGGDSPHAAAVTAALQQEEAYRTWTPSKGEMPRSPLLRGGGGGGIGARENGLAHEQG